MVKVGNEVYKVMGIIDFCVAEQYRGKGIGSLMLSEVSSFAQGKGIDFIMLISELDGFYLKHGYSKVETIHSWLRINEHTNYGVAVEHIDNLFIKPVSGKEVGKWSVWTGWVICTNRHRAYKRFKRDFQRVAFLLCVDFGGYGVMRKVGSSVVSPLSGRMCAGVNHDSSGISLEG